MSAEKINDSFIDYNLLQDLSQNQDFITFLEEEFDIDYDLEALIHPQTQVFDLTLSFVQNEAEKQRLFGIIREYFDSYQNPIIDTPMPFQPEENRAASSVPVQEEAVISDELAQYINDRALSTLHPYLYQIFLDPKTKKDEEFQRTLIKLHSLDFAEGREYVEAKVADDAALKAIAVYMQEEGSSDIMEDKLVSHIINNLATKFDIMNMPVINLNRDLLKVFLNPITEEDKAFKKNLINFYRVDFARNGQPVKESDKFGASVADKIALHPIPRISACKTYEEALVEYIKADPDSKEFLSDIRAPAGLVEPERFDQEYPALNEKLAAYRANFDRIINPESQQTTASSSTRGQIAKKSWSEGMLTTTQSNVRRSSSWQDYTTEQSPRLRAL